MNKQIQLNRKQELYLIDLGLQRLLDSLVQSTNGHRRIQKKEKRREWSASQRKKFKATMKRVWKEKRALKGQDK